MSKICSEKNYNSRTCIHVRLYTLSDVTVKTSGAINNSLLKASQDQRNISVAMESRVDDITGQCVNMKERLLVTENEEILYMCIKHS